MTRDALGLTGVGRAFFAAALIAMGAEHWVFGEFITGRAPAWPDGFPGGTLWASLSGLCFVGLGAAMLVDRGTRAAALSVAALIAIWALGRHLPVLATATFLDPAWTEAGKALALTGGALTTAGLAPPIRGRSHPAVIRHLNTRGRFLTSGRVALGLFLLITGIQHFLYTAFVASLIPAWFPGDAEMWTYFAGVALIAGGSGLLVPWTARLAALMSGLMVFSWFWIVHLPRTLGSISDGIAVFEALAITGIAFMLADGSGDDGCPPGSRSKARDRLLAERPASGQ